MDYDINQNKVNLLCTCKCTMTDNKTVNKALLYLVIRGILDLRD